MKVNFNNDNTLTILSSEGIYEESMHCADFDDLIPYYFDYCNCCLIDGIIKFVKDDTIADIDKKDKLRILFKKTFTNDWIIDKFYEDLLGKLQA